MAVDNNTAYHALSRWFALPHDYASRVFHFLLKAEIVKASFFMIISYHIFVFELLPGKAGAVIEYQVNVLHSLWSG